MDYLRQMTSYFTASATTDTTNQEQRQATDANTVAPVAVTNPAPPPAQHAFNQFNSDPQEFMEHNQVRIKGRFHKPSRRMSFVMVSEGNKDGLTKLNQTSGQRDRVNQYQIMSKHDYELNEKLGFPTIADTHETHHFHAQHLAMEQMPKGTNLTTLDREYQSRAVIDPSKSQNFVTNGLSGCALVREQTTLMHLQPAARLDNANGTFAGGDATERSVQQILPDADVFGNSQYQDGTNYWIQNQGTQVNIFGQHTDTHGKDWRVTTTRNQFDALPSTATSTALGARQGAKLELGLKAQIKSKANENLMSRGKPQGVPSQARQTFDNTLQTDLKDQIVKRNRNKVMESVKTAPRRNGYTD